MDINQLKGTIDKLQSQLAEAQEELKQAQKADEYGRRAYTVEECEWVVDSDGGAHKKHQWSGVHKNLVIQGRGFTTKAAAERFAKYEQLAFECNKAAFESWGGEKVDWGDGAQEKWCPRTSDGLVRLSYTISTSRLYPFKTKEQGQTFQKSIGDEDFILMLKGGDV